MVGGLNYIFFKQTYIVRSLIFFFYIFSPVRLVPLPEGWEEWRPVAEGGGDRQGGVEATEHRAEQHLVGGKQFSIIF